MSRLIDLSRKKFGQWTVLRRAQKTVRRQPYWDVACACGTIGVVAGNSLRCGDSMSCGCLATNLVSHQFRTHGQARNGRASREYNSYEAMRGRCEDSGNPRFADYGGRGITVCERWRNSRADFFADMGPRPAKTSLDRIDVNGNYEPSNCRWATAKEQAGNRRSKEQIRRDRSAAATQHDPR